MKYAKQLTDNELKDLLVYLAKHYYGANSFDNDYYILRNPSSITIGGNFDTVFIKGVKCSLPVKIEIDDFLVHTEDEDYDWGDMTIDYRKRMFSTYGNQYAVDCFLYDCEEDQL